MPWSRLKNEIFGNNGSKGLLGDAGKILGGS